MLPVLLFLLGGISLISSSEVLVMNDASFDKILSENAPMLIEFYAPWCGHCKALEPEYDSAALQLKEMKSPAKLGKVDVTAEDAKQLQKRFDIKGFPTLQYFSSSSPDVKPIKYEGQRTASAIANWAHKKSGPSVTVLTSAADVKELSQRVLAEDKFLVLGEFPIKEQTHAFEQVAAADESRDYFVLLGAEVPSVTVYRWFNLTQPQTTSQVEIVSSKDALTAFIAKASKPVLNSLEYTDVDVLQAKQSGIHLVEFFAPWCGYCKEFAADYDKIAVHFANSPIKVATVDGTVFEKTMEEEGADSFPTLKFYKNGASTLFTGNTNFDEVVQFVKEKMEAKAEVVTTTAEDFAKGMPVGEGAMALVACVSSSQVELVDALAFEFASRVFKVGRMTCKEGEEFASIYNIRGLVDTTKELTHSANFRKWLKRAAIPKLFKFNDDLFDQVQHADFKYLYLYLSPKEASPEVLKVLEDAAVGSSKFVDVSFAHADATFDYLLEYFGIPEDTLPVLRVLDLKAEELDSFEGPKVFDLAALEAFQTELDNGKVPKVVKAQEPYEEEEEEAPEDEEKEEL